ncbi:MAG: methyltransferase domain-containing protein [Deltaproteobacteria bacterium]|nr:methyltransferase domain-containing protein [Deltaproteobacteria bacterium]
MDRITAGIYERRAAEWIARRDTSADGRRRVARLASRLDPGSLVADLGCGPGWHGALLARRGLEVIGLDLSSAMLRAARRRVRGARLVRADLAHLPFARASLDAAWARNCYMHLPARELPAAFAELHRVLRPGAHVMLSLANLEALAPSSSERRTALLSRRGGEDVLRGRLFVARDPQGWTDLLEGAGFRAISCEPGGNPFWLWFEGRRARSLPDSLAPRLELLVCGSNPSPLAAETGVPFAGPGNRFWPAAIRAGLVASDRDSDDALRRGVGFTDLVKRVTASASAVSPREYARGGERLARLVRTWRPRALLFVGLEGFRSAFDRSARPGVLRGGFAGRPAYLMPSTSGRNASSSLAALSAHLRRARGLTRIRASG